jgi:hypothetical protein
MGSELRCTNCSAAPGCTARHTEEKMTEEISAGAYLILAGVIVVLASLAFRFFF